MYTGTQSLHFKDKNGLLTKNYQAITSRLIIDYKKESKSETPFFFPMIFCKLRSRTYLLLFVNTSIIVNYNLKYNINYFILLTVDSYS